MLLNLPITGSGSPLPLSAQKYNPATFVVCVQRVQSVSVYTYDTHCDTEPVPLLIDTPQTLVVCQVALVTAIVQSAYTILLDIRYFGMYTYPLVADTVCCVLAHNYITAMKRNCAKSQSHKDRVQRGVCVPYYPLSQESNPCTSKKVT